MRKNITRHYPWTQASARQSKHKLGKSYSQCSTMFSAKIASSPLEHPQNQPIFTKHGIGPQARKAYASFKFSHSPWGCGLFFARFHSRPLTEKRPYRPAKKLLKTSIISCRGSSFPLPGSITIRPIPNTASAALDLSQSEAHKPLPILDDDGSVPEAQALHRDPTLTHGPFARFPSRQPPSRPGSFSPPHTLQAAPPGALKEPRDPPGTPRHTAPHWPFFSVWGPFPRIVPVGGCQTAPGALPSFPHKEAVLLPDALCPCPIPGHPSAKPLGVPNPLHFYRAIFSFVDAIVVLLGVWLFFPRS
jgi:hypothetical protein